MSGASRHIVVLGCGLLGSYLATHLDLPGWTVAVLDREPKALVRLPKCPARLQVVGDALTLDALEEARIDDAYALIATTSEDNRNAAIAAVARACGASRAIARIRDRQSARSFADLGIEIVCPTHLEADVVFQHVREAHPRLQEGHPDV